MTDESSSEVPENAIRETTPETAVTENAGERDLAESQLSKVLAYARQRDYTGWDLYDGESSRFLRLLPIENKWVNLGFQQVVRRAPVNLRRPLLVEQRRNLMGSALFALANFTAYDLTGEATFRSDGLELVDWLLEQEPSGYSGYCGGHNHPLQGLHNRTPPDVPDVVTTTHAVRALLAAAEYGDGSYRETARTAAEFVLEDLEYERVPSGARIEYKPNDDGEMYTLNANALGARLLVDLYATFGDDRYREAATRILDYVVANQTTVGGWYYTEDPSSSHLSMDNFHNGFIIDSLLRYGAVCDDDRFADAVDDAVRFYRDLFESSGAPRWDESSTYPRDVHASAQGILTFSQLGEFQRAQRIMEWAVTNLSDGAGRFYHEKRRYYTKRITLMRWCQAWMAYALAVYLRRTTDVPTDDFLRAGKGPGGERTTPES